MKTIILLLVAAVITYAGFIYSIERVSYDTWPGATATLAANTTTTNTSHNGTIIVWDGDVSWYQHNPSKIVVFKKNGTKIWEVDGNVVSEEQFMNR